MPGTDLWMLRELRELGQGRPSPCRGDPRRHRWVLWVVWVRPAIPALCLVWVGLGRRYETWVHCACGQRVGRSTIVVTLLRQGAESRGAERGAPAERQKAVKHPGRGGGAAGAGLWPGERMWGLAS